MAYPVLFALPVIAALGGAAAHCEPRTNARWLTWGTERRKGVERAGRWAHRPRLQRAAIQGGAWFLAAETAAGLYAARGWAILALILAAVVLATVGAAWTYRRWRQHAAVIGKTTFRESIRHAPAVATQWWDHRRGYTVRLRDTLAAKCGGSHWQARVSPERDQIDIRPPYTFAGHPHELEAVSATVATLVPAEGLEPDWSKLHGRKPTVRFAVTEPPPGKLGWEGRIAIAAAGMKPDQLILGIGHRAQIIKASLESDSPHLGIGMGTGAGKSTLAAFWLIQRLRLGDIGLIVDGKRFSYPWAFKDMDAEYGLLPNIGYVRRIDDIHNALCWLGKELADRNERAERVINARGDLLGDIGKRLFIVCEELNMVTPLLKIYWQKIRQKGDPKQSPALMALSAVSFAGRAVGMHLVFIGQRLDADVLGCSGGMGGAVRGNIGVRCLARYDEGSWRLQAGAIPMPPSPSVPGRIQAWIGGQVSECQVPLIGKEHLRELAVGGIVTPCPVGMPGRSQSVSDAQPLPIGQAPEQGVVPGHPVRPANLVTLREAVETGMFGRRKLDAVRKQVNRRQLPDAGVEGSAKLYEIDELMELAR